MNIMVIVVLDSETANGIPQVIKRPRCVDCGRWSINWSGRWWYPADCAERLSAVWCSTSCRLSVVEVKVTSCSCGTSVVCRRLLSYRWLQVLFMLFLRSQDVAHIFFHRFVKLSFLMI